MKKTLVWTILVTLSLLPFSACAGRGVSSQTTNDSSGEGASIQGAGLATTPIASEERETPLALQLALGTFKLEETDYPVDAEQATALLPLWKAARSLSQSDTVAAAELQAVVNQIQETMMPEQLQVISTMDLTFQDMAVIAEELGLEIGAGRFGDISPEMQTTMQAARESGQIPPGGFGGVPRASPGGGFGGEMGLSPEQQQTAVAERGGLRQLGLGLPQPLLDAMIEFLEAKV